MADTTDKSSEKNPDIDLEQLRDLSFAPQWSSGRTSSSEDRPRESKPKRKSSEPARDRRPARKRPAAGGGDFRGNRDHRPSRPEPFEPIVECSIYPEDEPFDLLTQSIRSSLKVYELFEVTRLILEKTDRMVVVVSPLNDGAPPLYESLPDRQLFRDESKALQHSANLLLASIFEEKEEEVAPPSGNFSSVLRCKFSGKYLPPKSYHKFHALLQEHQRLNCPKVSVERVEKGLESVADADAVQEWLQSMSRRSVFRLRPEPLPLEPEEEKKPEETSEGSAEENPAESQAPEIASEALPEVTPETPEEAEAMGKEEKPEEPETVAKEEPADSTLVLDSREAALSHLIRTMKETLVRETRQARVPAGSLVKGEDEGIRKSFESYVEQQKRFPLDTANNVRMKLRKGKFFIFKKGKKGISYVAAVKRRNRPAGVAFADSAEKIISALESQPNIHRKKLLEILYPQSGAETETTGATPEQTRQISQDLKWLKSEGYLYEYGDGALELHPKESEPVKSAKASKTTPTPKTEEPASNTEEPVAPAEAEEPSSPS